MRETPFPFIVLISVFRNLQMVLLGFLLATLSFGLSQNKLTSNSHKNEPLGERAQGWVLEEKKTFGNSLNQTKVLLGSK